jgi:Domain of unknown function (DUF4232)
MRTAFISTVLLLMPAATLVAACTATPPTTPSRSSASTPAGSGAPSSPPPSTSPASSPPATSTPPPQGTQPCSTRSLQVKPGTRQGAAGTTYQRIVFTNISQDACTLYGYPGVSLAGGSPVAQIGLAAKENPQTPRQLVTLRPGTHASALLRIVNAQNYPKRRCGPGPASYLLVYPPNQKTPVYVSYDVMACSKPIPLLTVDVVKPGSGG